MNDKKVYLRILERDDIPRTTKWINHKEISDIMGYLPVLSLENQLDWYEKIKNDKSRFIFAICLKEGDEHIGNVALGNIDYISRNAMFSIFIFDRKYRSGGLGTEATRQCLDFGFIKLNLHKIYLRTSETFIEALKMYEKLGFMKEGVLREHYYSNGKYTDKIIYSILKREYIHGE
jgi:diamine N-acetyltransferase